jgi:hypothetical protein
MGASVFPGEAALESLWASLSQAQKEIPRSKALAVLAGLTGCRAGGPSRSHGRPVFRYIPLPGGSRREGVVRNLAPHPGCSGLLTAAQGSDAKGTLPCDPGNSCLRPYAGVYGLAKASAGFWVLRRQVGSAVEGGTHRRVRAFLVGATRAFLHRARPSLEAWRKPFLVCHYLTNVWTRKAVNLERLVYLNKSGLQGESER